MMRVSMPTLYGNIQSQLQRLTSELQYTNAQISTGRKYQAISDNPVDVGSLMGMNAESSQMVQYKKNLDTGNSWLSATETTLTNINTLVSSTASLAEQMATGTYTAAQRAAAAQQVQQYMDEFMQMGNTRYQGHYILGGYKIDTEAFTKGAFFVQPPQMNLQPGSDGAATSSGTYTGSGPASYLVRIATAGPTGGATPATYQVSEDGGQTWSAASDTAVGPVAIGSDGVKISFSAASLNWVAGDEFTVDVPFTPGAFFIQPPEMNLQSGSTGAATSSGTYTGSSDSTYLVDIVTGGATGAATYRVSQDGGQTWSATKNTSADEILGNGVHASFSGTWAAGDRFSISTYQPIIYQGDNNNLELGIGRNSRLAVSQVGGQVVGGGTGQVVGGAGGADDFFKIMAHLKSNLEANNAAGVGARLQELKDYQANLLSSLAGVGAALNRVTAKQNAYDTLNEQLTKDIAKTGDTDLVAAATTLATQQLAYQAALQSSSKIMSMSLVDYLPT